MRAIYLMKNSSTLCETVFLFNDDLQRGPCWSTRARAPMDTCPECCWKTGAFSVPATHSYSENFPQAKFQTPKPQTWQLILLLAWHFKSRQATWVTVLLEIWGHRALGKSTLHQLGETSSGGTPHHHTSPVSSAWKSSNTSTSPHALETLTEKKLLNVMRNNEFKGAETSGGNFYLRDCWWQQGRLGSVRAARNACTV